MNYTVEHLKIVHNAGAQKFSFGQTLELVSLLERNGLLHVAGSGTPNGNQPGRKRKIQKLPTAKRTAGKRRGNLSLTITGFLSTKGTKGAHVKDIAKAVNAPLASVRVWFYATGKKYLKTGEIKKVGRATYGYFKPAKVAK